MANQPNKTTAQKFNETVGILLSPMRAIVAIIALLVVSVGLGGVVEQILTDRAALKPEEFALICIGVGAVLVSTK